jgi:phenylpropionate dioxygenase-like ring-hydroxylating dioxygenase large terminal subunit
MAPASGSSAKPTARFLGVTGLRPFLPGALWLRLGVLGDPIHEIPAIAEAEDSSYRRIPEFYETWRCAGLRVMENELDLAHPTFVHTTTFGSEDHPTPDP